MNYKYVQNEEVRYLYLEPNIYHDEEIQKVTSFDESFWHLFSAKNSHACSLYLTIVYPRDTMEVESKWAYDIDYIKGFRNLFYDTNQ